MLQTLIGVMKGEFYKDSQRTPHWIASEHMKLIRATFPVGEDNREPPYQTRGK